MKRQDRGEQSKMLKLKSMAREKWKWVVCSEWKTHAGSKYVQKGLSGKSRKRPAFMWRDEIVDDHWRSQATQIGLWSGGLSTDLKKVYGYGF